MNSGLRLGVSILSVIVVAALVGPWVAPDPQRVALESAFSPPGPGHWLGTDGLGRDVSARVVQGARVSLLLGGLAALFALALGVPLGAWAGYRGGLVDRLVSKAIEVVLCVPTLVLALAILGASPPWLTGLPDVLRISLVIGATGWTPVARFLRAEVLRLRSSELVSSARASGASEPRVVLRHLLPSAAAPALVTAAFAVGAAVLLEALLSFLGIGVRPPTATWGGMLDEARSNVERAWWLALFPGAGLFLTVLACNLLGEGLRDLLAGDLSGAQPLLRRRGAMSTKETPGGLSDPVR